MQNQSDNASTVGNDKSSEVNPPEIGRLSQNGKDSFDPKLKQEFNKSRVRIIVTYVATVFIFGGGLTLIIWFNILEKYDKAIQIFNIILPIAAGIVTYWFATRSNRSKNDSDNTS